MNSFDVVIVGAGIIGTSCALALAEQGRRVAIFERGSPGCEASWAAGGMLSPAPYLPNDDPLVPLAIASLRLYPEYVHSIELASQKSTNHTSSGAIELFFGRDAVAERDSYVSRCRTLKVDVESITASEARRREPAIASFARAAAFFPNEQAVEPRALIEAALDAAREKQVEICAHSPVESIIIDAHRCAGIIAKRERVYADYVVVAAGSFSQELFRQDASSGSQLAQMVPTRPVRGQMMALLSRDTTLSHVVRSSRAYLIPRSNGQIVAGSTLEDVGFDKQTTPEGLRQIRKAAAELVPSLEGAEIVDRWAGLRPATPDGLPILGSTGLAGLILATGHYRNGILLAPITAQLVRDWATQRTSDFSDNAFSPMRFQHSRE